MSSRPAQMTSRLCNSGVETLNDAPPQFARQGKIEKLQQASVSTGAMFSSEDCNDVDLKLRIRKYQHRATFSNIYLFSLQAVTGPREWMSQKPERIM